MTAHDVPYHQAAHRSIAELMAATLLFAAVSFNAVLAIVNAQLMPLNPGAVIACEGLIVIAAHLVALLYFRARMTPWYALIILLAGFALFRAMAVGTVEVKYLRDVLLIPTFIILGMTFPRERLTTLLVGLQFLVLGVLLLEAASLAGYSELFNIKSYYINTRGYSEEAFWNTSSDLYVSASRPDDRFFSFIEAHRMSSIFLEPVSLGNYCIIILCYVLATFRELSTSERIILLGGSLILMIGCDSRLAAVSVLIIAAVSLVATSLPPRFSLIFPLAIFIAAAAAVWLLGFEAGPDNFPGRLAHTTELLQNYGLKEFLGISDAYLSQAVDSGLAYLITTQSLFLTVLLWLFICLLTEERDRQQIIFKIGLALYLSLTMLVSFSFLSIKTAAILWFVLGALQTGPLHPAMFTRRPRLSGAMGRGQI